MPSDFPTALPAYGLEGPSAGRTVEKSLPASHTEFLTPPPPPRPPRRRFHHHSVHVSAKNTRTLSAYPASPGGAAGCIPRFHGFGMTPRQLCLLKTHLYVRTDTSNNNASKKTQ